MAAGAEIKEDLSESCVVLGVKQVPIDALLSDRSYIFFSHTIKAQPENMPLLRACLDKNIRLFDYECIREGGSPDKPRTVAFGMYAGIVGMVDVLQGLGQRLLADGFSTPFLYSNRCFMNTSLDEAKTSVVNVGKMISDQVTTPTLSR